MEKIKPSLTSVFFILLALSLILSCFRPQVQKTQSTGVYHLVKKNETVQMIAQAYHVKLQDLEELNNIKDIKSIKEGSVIFIPNANRVIDDVTTNVKKMNTVSGVRTKKEISDNVKAITKSQNIKEVNPVRRRRLQFLKKRLRLI